MKFILPILVTAEYERLFTTVSEVLPRLLQSVLRMVYVPQQIHVPVTLGIMEHRVKTTIVMTYSTITQMFVQEATEHALLQILVPATMGSMEIPVKSMTAQVSCFQIVLYVLEKDHVSAQIRAFANLDFMETIAKIMIVLPCPNLI